MQKEEKPPPITWRDLVFANIDGWNVYPLAIFISLLLTYFTIGLNYLFTGSL